MKIFLVVAMVVLVADAAPLLRIQPNTPLSKVADIKNVITSCSKESDKSVLDSLIVTSMPIEKGKEFNLTRRSMRFHNCHNKDKEISYNAIWKPHTHQRESCADNNAISNAMYTVEEITSGTIKVSIQFGYFPIYYKEFDLCDVLNQVDVSCPVKRGTYTRTISTALQTNLPSGHYSGNGIATDQNGNQLLCENLDIRI